MPLPAGLHEPLASDITLRLYGGCPTIILSCDWRRLGQFYMVQDVGCVLGLENLKMLIFARLWNTQGGSQSSKSDILICYQV